MLKTALVITLAAASVHPSSVRPLIVAQAPTCAINADARMLDYWTGTWSVGTPGAPASGRSTLSLSLDKCLLVEQWSSTTTAHNGTNMMAYNAELHEWSGLFVDNHGRVHALTGTVVGGVGEFTGPGRDANGRTVLNRVRVRQVSPERVNQSWEKSVDRGSTWTNEYQMEYIRKP